MIDISVFSFFFEAYLKYYILKLLVQKMRTLILKYDNTLLLLSDIVQSIIFKNYIFINYYLVFYYI